MAERTWTPQQKQVIDDRGNNLIVSAAAGSGKTAVLVERIIKRITDEENPTDVDRLLVVTFTNAAAAEMKERLRSAIEDILEKDPGNERMGRQQLLLTNASITTIDSFCLKIIRNYYQTADIDPAFRIMEEEEKKLIASDVLDDLLEEHFNTLDEPFLRLVERYEDPRHDGVIAQMIDKLYENAMSTPWPLEWLEDCKKIYRAQTVGDLEDSAFIKALEENIKTELRSCRNMAERCLKLANSPDGPSCYTDTLSSDLSLFGQLIGADGFNGMYSIISGPEFTKLGNAKPSGEEEKAIREVIKAGRGIYKDLVKKMKEGIFTKDLAGHLEDVKATSEQAVVLIDLAIEYAQRLAAKKRKLGVMDFGDIEHNALRVLLKGTGADAVETESAKELRSLFDEIMIDEYQDSNYIQELILTTIAGDEGSAPTLFVVGDVKQSIYSFRMARPELFIQRYERFSRGEGGKAIDLDRNFRSRPGVLDSVNSLFERIMHASLGGVEYDENAKLKPGATYEGEDHKTEVCLVEFGANYFGDKRDQKWIEAGAIGLKIKEYVSPGGLTLYDAKEKTFRPCRYGDIVILLRTMSEWSGEFAQALTYMGIPVITDVSTGFFETMEVQTVLNYLRILDNPVQDIPFVAVLHSAIGGMTNDDLAVIKASFAPEGSFYEAALRFASEGRDERIGKKLESFFETYRSLREMVSGDLSDLIRHVCEDTGFIYYVATLEGSETRRGNLKLLEDKAVSYAKTSYHGLFNFLRYIEKLKKHDLDYGEAISSSDSGAVRIMSIHKSKGLEFPVVFLAAATKQFNLLDARASLIVNHDFGIASGRIDLDRRVKSSTLLRQGFARFETQATIGEELRLLYVAMTRAKEKLVITAGSGEFKSVEGKDPEQIQTGKAKSYIDIIRLAADEEYFDICTCDGLTVAKALNRTFSEQEAPCKKDLDRFFEGETIEELKAVRNYDYSGGNVAIPVKVSVTELKKHREEELMSGLGGETAMDEQGAIVDATGNEAQDRLAGSLQEQTSGLEESRETPAAPEHIIPLPAFMGGEAGQNAGAALGTLCHLIMQHFPFDKDMELGAYLDDMAARGMFAEDRRKTIPERWFTAFMAGTLCARMRKAALDGKLKREQPFMYEVPANEVKSDYDPSKTVIVQGIIDAYFEEDGELVLIDYKTDKGGKKEELKQRYKFQLDHYACALERITGKKVKEKIIYSFALGEEILL